jgi:hypothetical protein
MPLAADFGVKAAKAGVSAARKSASRALHRGQAQADNAIDNSGRTIDAGLTYVERALHDGLDAIAARGRQAQNRIQTLPERVVPDRYLPDVLRATPRRHGPPIATALTGVGAGVLLALLFARRDGGSTPEA